MDHNFSLVEHVVAHATSLTHDQITPDAIEICKLLSFDSHGTGLGGFQHALGQKAVTYTDGLPERAAATILGTGKLISCEEAVFANATMIEVLRLADSHRSAGHVASQVILMSLAMAEAEHASGRQLIAAIVAAFDFVIWVGHAVRAAQRRRGLDVKDTVEARAAALAAGVCAGLDTGDLAQSFSLAADLFSGTEQFVYESGSCDTKDLIAGFAARNGVFAVNLAAAGLFGPRESLEVECRFFRALGDVYDPDLFADLGSPSSINTTSFKPHGVCRPTHQAVDVFQQILNRGPMDLADIRHTRLRTCEHALKPGFRADLDPPAPEVAGLGIRVATGMALLRGSARPEDFNDSHEWGVRRLRHMIDKFKVLTSADVADSIFHYCMRLQDKDMVQGLLALTTRNERQVEAA